MNFLCDRCKQKYHVADEKVRGRAVTRFKCKKCEHVIELRMTGTDGMPSNALPDDGSAPHEAPASIPPPASAPLPSARASAPLPSGARPPTSTGLPTAPRVPTNLGGAAPAPRAGSSALPSLGNRPAAGSPGLPSRPSNPPPGSVKRASLPPSPLLAGTPRSPTSTGLPTAAARAASAPASRPATSTGLPTAAARAVSPPAASPLRTGLATKTADPPRAPSAASALLNASETGWYAGVRDLPVGPLTRSELAAKIESGDITPDSLVWREGLDDWRPLRSVAELSDIVRVASQKMSDGFLGTMGRREPASASGKVVPIAQGRAPAAAPAAKDMGGFASDDDEPTRMTALGDLIATAEERGLLAPQSKSATTSSKPGGHRASVAPPPPAPAPATKSASPATTSASPARTSVAPPPPASATASAPPASASAVAMPVVSTPAAGPASAAKAAAIAGPNEPTFNIPPGSVGIGATAAPIAPAATPPATAAVATAQPQQQNDRKAIPIGIWILMAGVLMAGVAVGLFLRTPSNSQQPATVAANTNPTPPPAAVRAPDPPTRQVGAEIQLPPDNATPPPAPTQPAATGPAQPVVAAAADTHHPHASGGASTTSTASAPRSGGSTLSAAQLAALNAQLGAQGSGIAQSTGPTNTQLRAAPTTQTQDPAGGGLTGEARAGQVIAAYQRQNVVGSCWTAAQRRNPAHPPESIRVALDVSPMGRATSVRISGANDPDLANCIQQRTRAQIYGAGGAVSTEASFNLVLGQ